MGGAVAKDSTKLVKERQLLRRSARATKTRNYGRTTSQRACPISDGSSGSDGGRCCSPGRGATACDRATSWRWGRRRACYGLTGARLLAWLDIARRTGRTAPASRSRPGHSCRLGHIRGHGGRRSPFARRPRPRCR